MSFGIKPKSMKMIIDTLQKREEVEKAVIFGSRSMGNYKNGSDIDIAIFGSDITWEILNQIGIELNDKLPLPYYFDIVHYESLKHDRLKEHIHMFGKVFYKKALKKEGGKNPFSYR